MDPGFRRQDCQPRNKIQWLKEHMGCAIPVWRLERVTNLSMWSQGHALFGYGRPANISAKSSQLISAMSFSDHARVPGKTSHLGSLPRTLTIRKRWQGLQCENLSTLMWATGWLKVCVKRSNSSRIGAFTQ